MTKVQKKVIKKMMNTVLVMMKVAMTMAKLMKIRLRVSMIDFTSKLNFST